MSKVDVHHRFDLCRWNHCCKQAPTSTRLCYGSKLLPLVTIQIPSRVRLAQFKQVPPHLRGDCEQSWSKWQVWPSASLLYCNILFQNCLPENISITLGTWGCWGLGLWELLLDDWCVPTLELMRQKTYILQKTAANPETKCWFPYDT